MSGNPGGSEKQHDSEEDFRSHGDGALQRRLERSYVLRGLNEKKHGPEGQGHDQNGGESGGENHFHRTGARPPGSGMEKDSAINGKAERGTNSDIGKPFTASSGP